MITFTCTCGATFRDINGLRSCQSSHNRGNSADQRATYITDAGRKHLDQAGGKKDGKR